MGDPSALAETFRRLPVFEGLSDEQIAWLVEHSEEERMDSGVVVMREGDAADSMFIILEGEIRFHRESAGLEAQSIVAGVGQIGGLLPYSRMTHYTGTVKTITPFWGARIRATHFDEMLRVIPALGQRLVGLMADRIREATKFEQQQDKLSALGKLSAGLAHEINNPAAAASRAAATLRETLDHLREANLRLDHCALSCPQRTVVAEFERDAALRLGEFQPLDPLEQSDREDQIGAWLEGRGVADAWRLAPALVESGTTAEHLETLARDMAPEALAPVIARICAAIGADKLVGEIQNSVSRITDLVCAVKEYSYMDQAPEQEVDVHSGLESTLTIMGYKLRKNNVEVIRQYDRSLPHIRGFGRELNQVWTNLIDNAADAMKNGGRLRISTSRESDRVMIDIEDNGPGISPEVRPRLFEPFFTTKDVGEGTGLGLDTVSRIVRKHRGEIRVDSKPGETHFQVLIPSQGS